jgi:hypothetical protein
MEPLDIGPWQIVHDKEATKAAYARISKGGAEECGCRGCVNYVAARDRVFCQEVLHVFDAVGIDYRKDAEVYHLNRVSPEWHHYGGWFHLIGEVKSSYDRYHEVCKGFSWEFRNHRDLANEAFGDMPLIQVEVDIIVPWVIAEAEPE